MAYMINGEAQNFAEPVVTDGTTFVPVGNLVDSLGGYVSWDNISKVASIELGDHKARIQADNSNVEVNGTIMELQAAAYIEDGLLWVPVRFFENALGCTIQVNDTFVEINRAL